MSKAKGANWSSIRPFICDSFSSSQNLHLGLSPFAEHLCLFLQHSGLICIRLVGWEDFDIFLETGCCQEVNVLEGLGGRTNKTKGIGFCLHVDKDNFHQITRGSWKFVKRSKIFGSFSCSEMLSCVSLLEQRWRGRIQERGLREEKWEGGWWRNRGEKGRWRLQREGDG